MTHVITPIKNLQFAKDIDEGLSCTPKKLSSKYFYDAKGDELFQQIMSMEEYYPTNCEYEILSTYRKDLLQDFAGQRFDLIELGAGDGTKTKLLLRHFLQEKADFRYVPIDISGNILAELKTALHEEMPALEVSPVQGDYFKSLKQIPHVPGVRKVVLFMGGNIGNLDMDEANVFLRVLASHLHKGDLLMTGFDLKKDPQVILDAYNDAKGITAAFNLNLLYRINRELGANFEIDQFQHWPTYNPLTGATKSYLVSSKEQEVHIEALNKTYHFEAHEAIDMELSQKYSLKDIETLAEKSGFQLRANYTDERKYFVDSLWEL
ncbi:MAG: L-histidine N(alpha)-methyltransferase [Bacteroidota bacterium]